MKCGLCCHIARQLLSKAVITAFVRLFFRTCFVRNIVFFFFCKRGCVVIAVKLPYASASQHNLVESLS